jgi:hypothetical protein
MDSMVGHCGHLVDDSEDQENEDQCCQSGARGRALRDIVELMQGYR